MDERALDLGFQALDRATADGEHELDAFRKGIEAYEAAKWRPIVEAPECADWFLIAWPNSDYPPQSLRRGPNPGVWMSTDSGVWYESTLRDNGAMFRTIDPPSPVSTPPAAEDAS